MEEQKIETRGGSRSCAASPAEKQKEKGKSCREKSAAGMDPEKTRVSEALLLILERVDPELKQGNPVRHWALADDHCTFVFRDGRKVTVEAGWNSMTFA